MNKPSKTTKAIFIVLLFLITLFSLIPLHLLGPNLSVALNGRVVEGQVIDVKTELIGGCTSEHNCRSNVIKIIKYFDHEDNEQNLATGDYGNLQFLQLMDVGDTVKIVYVKDKIDSARLYFPYLDWAYSLLWLLVTVFAIKGAFIFLNHNRNFNGT